MDPDSRQLAAFDPGPPRSRAASAVRATMLAAWALLCAMAGSPSLAHPAERPAARSVDAGPLAIGFVTNRGQWPDPVRLRASAPDRTLWILDDGWIEAPYDPAKPAWRLRLDRNWRAEIRPERRLPGRLHYLLGAEPAGWITHLPHYATVAWQDRGSAQRLSLRLDGTALRLEMSRASQEPGSEMARSDWIGDERPPWSWQRLESSGPSYREMSPARGAASSEATTLARALESAWSRSRSESPRETGRRAGLARLLNLGASSPDPASPRSWPGRLQQTGPGEAQLAWSSYLGGGGSELVRGMAVDARGQAYLAGSTTSSNLPTVDPLQGELGNGGSLQDAFVAKVSADGQRLIWATYLGGNRQDEALDIAIDAEGRAHLTGYTMSPDFPMEQPFQPRVNLADGIFSGDAFASKLDPDGSRLEWSTPLGGTARDVGKGIAVDAAGFVYITGWTGSNFPGVNALYPLNRGVVDAFVVKIVPAGNDVVYSTHLGGSEQDLARDIAVDASGRAYIVGTTQSVNLRLANPLRRANAGGRDAFLARFASDGQALDWATYLGGRGEDFGIGIALGPEGSVTVVGRSDAPNFPRQDPFQSTRSGPSDLFVSRLTAEGDALIFSSYLGGSAAEGDCAAVDEPRIPSTPTPAPGTPRLPEGSKFPDGPLAAVAVDAAGRTYLATCSASGNAPLERPLQSTRSGRLAAYLAVLDSSGGSLAWGSYIGGQGLDLPRTLALGPDGSVYLAGQTTSTDFPLAPAAPGTPIQDGRAGTDDGFALKIAPLFEAPTATPPPPTATIEPSPTARPEPSATASATQMPASATPPPRPSPTASPTLLPPILWLPWIAQAALR